MIIGRFSDGELILCQKNGNETIFMYDCKTGQFDDNYRNFNDFLEALPVLTGEQRSEYERIGKK